MVTTASKSVLGLDDLLRPISNEHPSGEKQDAADIYGQIEQARAADDTLARDRWQRDLKKADWNAVISLAAAALKHKVKDLKLAVLLTEALTKQHGLAGMCEGFQLTRELLTKFWDTLYPKIDDGDLEARAIQLEWLNKNLPFYLEQMPLTIAINGEACSWQHRQEALKLEGLAQSDDEKAQAARENMINEGKITLEQFEAAVSATPREFYENLGEALRRNLEQLTLLEEVVDQKLGVEEAPGLEKIKKALDIQVLLQSNGIPAWRLGDDSRQAPRLGWCTWLAKGTIKKKSQKRKIEVSANYFSRACCAWNCDRA